MLRQELFALALGLGFLVPAAASSLDGPDAQMNWRLNFGGDQPLRAGYGLTLGYRSTGPELPAGQLLELDVSDRAAFARLAGLPLFERNYSSRQNEADALPADSGSTPWYSQSWVLWTAGGIAATAALAGGGGDALFSDGTCTGECNSGTSVVSGDVVGPNPLCVMSGDEEVPETCVEGALVGGASTIGLAEPDEQWLNSGTGRMGDLIAR